jgi:hypothetical protein
MRNRSAWATSPTAKVLTSISELAALLATGYMGLAQTPRNLGISCPREPQKELDVFCPESPHVVKEFDTGGLGG